MDQPIVPRILGWLLAFPLNTIFFQKACTFVRIQPPKFGRALGIVTLTLGVNILVGLSVRFLVHKTLGSQSVSGIPTWVVMGSLAIPLNMLLGGAIYRTFLKVGYGKGILVWLLEFLMVLALILSCYGLVFLGTETKK